MSSLTQSSYKSFILKALMGVQIVVMPLNCYGTSAGLPDDTTYSSSSGPQAYASELSASDDMAANLTTAALTYVCLDVANEQFLSPCCGFLKSFLPSASACWEKFQHWRNSSVPSSEAMNIEEIFPKGVGNLGMRQEFKDLISNIDQTFLKHVESLEGQTDWYKRPIVDHFMPYPRHLIGYQYVSPSFIIDIYRMDEKDQPLKTLYTLNPKVAFALIAFEELGKPLNVKQASRQLCSAYKFEKQEVIVPALEKEEEELVRSIDRKLNSSKLKASIAKVDQEQEESKLDSLPSSFNARAFSDFCLNSWELPLHLRNVLKQVFNTHAYFEEEMDVYVSLNTSNATFLLPFNKEKDKSSTSLAQVVLHISKIISKDLGMHTEMRVESSHSSPSFSSRPFESFALPGSVEDSSKSLVGEESSESEDEQV